MTLLDGVTGSGKTEVYLEAVAETLRRGKQVLILVPEIALTADFLERFSLRFGAAPGEWHSEVPPRGRERVWRGVADGDVQVVVGARSALFLPFKNLGLIVVDEEHDLAYKQEDGAIYNARDMGGRARPHRRLSGGAVVGDAVDRSRGSTPTPAATGASCCRRAIRRRRCPTICAIDLRKDQPPRGRFLSPPLVAAVGEALGREAAGAPVSQPARLRAADALPHLRPSLPVPELLDVAGRSPLPRRAALPPLRPLRAASERLPAVRRCGEPDAGRPGHRAAAGRSDDALPRRAHHRAVQRSRRRRRSACGRSCVAVAKGEVDIVIGTQLVAKGHNFPFLTLVGVVDADLGLAHGDLRAAERTFQLLSQVTGRAGRAGGASRALLQSWTPEHPVIQAIVSGDREQFYAARSPSAVPPGCRRSAGWRR